MILEGDRAVGVRVVPTKPLAPGKQSSRVIRARKQIIVSGGTLSSPLILQRSGIGDPQKLRRAGVKPLVGKETCVWMSIAVYTDNTGSLHIDLPGVGLNFQDH